MSDIFDRISVSARPRGDIFDKVSSGDIFDEISEENPAVNAHQPASIPGYPTGFFERRIIPETEPEKREQYWAMPPKEQAAPERTRTLKAPKSRLEEEFKRQADLYAQSGMQSRAGTMYMMAGLGRLIEKSGGGNFGTWIKQIYQEEARQNTQMAEALRKDPRGAVDAINQKIVQGALALLDPQLALMPLPAGYGAARALTQYGMGEPLPDSLIKGMESALIAKGFGLSHGMKPLTAGAKMGALGATEAAATTATEGGTPKEAALAALEGGTTTGLFGAMGAAKMGPAGMKAYETFAPSVGHKKALQIAQAVETNASEIPIPEPEKTIRAQIDMLKKGKRPAVLLTKGEKMPGIPEGMKSMETERGTFIYSPEKITEAEIQKAVTEDRVGDVLGYGIPRKPEQVAGVVTVRGKDGTEKQAVVTDKENMGTVIDAARKVTEPGDTVQVESSQEVVGKRVADIKKSAYIEPVTSNPKPDGGKYDIRKIINGEWAVFDRESGDLLDAFKTEKEAREYQPKPKDKSSKSNEYSGIIQIYRGEHSGNKGGSYYSPNREWVRQFTQSGQDKEISSVYIDASRIYKKDPLPSASSESDFDAAVREAREKGYPTVWFDEGRGEPNSIYVIDKKSLSKNHPNQSRPSEKGGSAVKPDISPVDAETKKFFPRQTRPIVTIEQQKRIAKKKAVKEQQLQIESAEEAKKAVHSMIRERRNRLNLASYETNLFCNEIEQATSRRQREVIPFIIEDTDIPKGLNRPDLEKIIARDRENLRPIARQIKRHFDDGWQRMREHAPEMSAQQIEDYVTHIWDIPKGQKRMVSNWFTTQNRFLKKRFIETINDGVEKFGLQPKVLDITEIIRIHDSIMNRVIENNRFVEDLRALKKDGVPLIERADKAPQNWVYFDHPALRRGLVIPGEAKMGEKVSPELADLLTEMGVAIGRRISPKAFGEPVSKMGEYRPGETPEVRFQRFISNRTIAHEIGHHIDEALNLGDSFLGKYKDELYAINKERIESFAADPKKKSYAESAEEQIAEFFAILFTKPDKAKQLAPTAMVDILERLKQDGTLTKLVDFDFEKSAKNLIEEQMNTMVKLPVKVHPDLEKPLKVIFDSRIDHPALQAYETANGVLKKTKLSLSLFHHMALGETAVSTMGLRKTAGIYFDPVKIYKAMAQGKFDIYQKEPIARDAISNGLQVGATSDIPVNMIQTKLNNLARISKGTPVARELTAFLRTFNEAWDKALWNYLHDTLKLYTYEHLTSKIDPAKDAKQQKQEIAQFVNDTFGGQNWDALMVSPKSLQLMSWSLLSPDWTLSTLRQALAPTGIGSIHKETAALRKKMGKYFWIKAALYFGVGINMLNYTFRKKDEDEHPEYYQGQKRSILNRTMAGNTIGHKTHLFVGRYEDGTERYIRWGKQFRELPEMFFDDTGFCPLTASLKKVGGKLSPVIQHTFDTFTGMSPSGFRNEDIYGKAGWDKVAGIAKSLVKAPLPFSSRSLFQENKEFHLTDIAMPSSKGMTRYRSMELFKLAIAKDDERMLKEVYQETLRNNLPAYTLFGSALASLKAESTKELNEGLKTVADIQEQLRHAKSSAEVKRLKNRYDRIQKENMDRKAGLVLLDAAIAKVEKHKAEEAAWTK